jgi:hypothetical protein
VTASTVAVGNGQSYRFAMSTLTEIETAVERLPLHEQEALLRRLAAKVARKHSTPTPDLREQWMGRLDVLRTSITTGKYSSPTEKILSELREERN